MTNTAAHDLRKAAERFPDKTAFRDAGKSITFAGLDRGARVLARMIHEKLGGASKQAVGVYLPKGVDCVTAFMGVIYSGNYYTPLDMAMPKERLEKILDTLRPALIITDSAHSGEIPAVPAVLTDRADTVPIADEVLQDILSSVIDTDVIYVMFTSGSTGNPKGVTITHRGVIDYVDWLTETFAFDETTVFGNQASFYFDNSVLDLYSTLRNGCETVIIPEERFLSGTRLCAFLKESGINTIYWVPSAMALVANSGALDEIPLNQLTRILFSGETMPTKVMNHWRRRIPHAVYANLYGPTEVSVDCTCYVVDREFDDAESLPIGTACRNTGILVLNGQDRPVQAGETGELCVRGSGVAHGYYGDFDKTRQAFVQNPLNGKYPEIIYRTGDLVKYNERGELLFVGRKDHQIKHRGYRIELGEIETAAFSAPGAESCCAVYDAENQRIVLFVTPETIDKKALYAHMKRLLPKYMLPGLITAEKTLPLNQNGKIDRKILQGRLSGNGE